MTSMRERPPWDKVERLSDLLDERASTTPQAVLMTAEGRAWTYEDVSVASTRLAHHLAELGVSNGSRVAVAAPNLAEWVLTLMATSRRGASLVPLNVLYREHEFEQMLNDSGAEVLICVDEDRGFDFVSFLERLRPRIPGVRSFVFAGDRHLPGSIRMADILDGTIPESPNAAAPEAEVEAPAVILYTSGTTGVPKGAMLRHSGILSSARAQAEHLGLRSDDVVIGHMPINHVGGLTCTLVAAMVVGASVVLLPTYHPEHALDAVATAGVTVFVGVPTMYTRMLDLPGMADVDRRRIRLCIVGGTNVEPPMIRRINAAFPNATLVNLYGLTETSGGVIISVPGDDVETLAATLGVPIGAFEAQVVDQDGQLVADGTDGELQVRGACVAAGYWNLPDASAGAFLADGWLATGDIATRREDGRFVMRGRKKEMYVRGGYNVYPAEVENVVATHPAVSLCAVVGVHHPALGEVGIALVVPGRGLSVEAAELLELCRTRLARYKVPEEIRIVDDLPVTPTGKISKASLREDLGSPGS